MSIVLKIGCVLMLATSAFAEGKAFTDNALPTMAAAGSVAASATVPPAEIPGNNRSVVLVIGIAAVALTFQRVIFRGRQTA